VLVLGFDVVGDSVVVRHDVLKEVRVGLARVFRGCSRRVVVKVALTRRDVDGAIVALQRKPNVFQRRFHVHPIKGARAFRVSGQKGYVGRPLLEFDPRRHGVVDEWHFDVFGRRGPRRKEDHGVG